MSAARLELSRSAVVPSEMITYTVVDDGDIVLIFGFDYGIGQRSWQPARLRHPRRSVTPCESSTGMSMTTSPARGSGRPRENLTQTSRS
jgi:hypothetical protein